MTLFIHRDNRIVLSMKRRRCERAKVGTWDGEGTVHGEVRIQRSDSGRYKRGKGHLGTLILVWDQRFGKRELGSRFQHSHLVP